MKILICPTCGCSLVRLGISRENTGYFIFLSTAEIAAIGGYLGTYLPAVFMTKNSDSDEPGVKNGSRHQQKTIHFRLFPGNQATE